MKQQGIDPTLLDDVALVARARAGDRLAFGVLYLRHGEAAWRLACTVSGFSPDAELAVIDGFTAVFDALPREMGPDTRFRPHLLACVRQSSLDRLPRRSGMSWRRPKPAAASVIEPDVLVLSGVEHHLLVGALRHLPERHRSALWLTEVERMTPAEASAVLGLEPARVTDLAAQAREVVVDVCLAAHGRSVFRPGCQHTVDRLGAYVRGQLTPRERGMIKAHLDRCLPCRMRRSEVTDVAGSLIGALPPLPLLGGEVQRHWLAFGSAGARPVRTRRREAGPRRVPAQVAVAASVLAFLFGLTAVVTPRASNPGTVVAAPAANEVSDVPPPRLPSRADEVTEVAAAAAPAPAPAVVPAHPSTPAQAPTSAKVQLPAVGSFTAAAKRPVEKPPATPAPAVPASDPPVPPRPTPVTPAAVVPQPDPPAAPVPPTAPVPTPAAPAPTDEDDSDGDEAEDRDRDRKRDRDGDRDRDRDRDGDLDGDDDEDED